MFYCYAYSIHCNILFTTFSRNPSHCTDTLRLASLCSSSAYSTQRFAFATNDAVLLPSCLYMLCMFTYILHLALFKHIISSIRPAVAVCWIGNARKRRPLVSQMWAKFRLPSRKIGGEKAEFSDGTYKGKSGKMNKRSEIREEVLGMSWFLLSLWHGLQYKGSVIALHLLRVNWI